MLRTPRGRAGGLEPLAAKVPEITVLFWVLKVLTTGMGEAMSDFMGQHSVPVAALVGILGTALAFRLQYRRREYHAPTYWFCVMMVAIFGTMVADGIKDGLGLSYAVTTPFFAALVAIVFWRWRRSEGTLDIHTITTRRRETYYWCAVLATFALGTAAGDLTAITLGWGFLPSAALFFGIIAVPLLGWWRWGLNPVVAFWAAYVVTRPLGASFADWFSKPHGETGLALGDGTVSAIELVLFVALVSYTAIRRDDIQDRRRPGVLAPRPAEG
jgi:uncharacterized membrane-anchored protein